MRFLNQHQEVGLQATLLHLMMIQTILNGHVAARIHCPVISPTYPMCLGKNQNHFHLTLFVPCQHQWKMYMSEIHVNQEQTTRMRTIAKKTIKVAQAARQIAAESVYHLIPDWHRRQLPVVWQGTSKQPTASGHHLKRRTGWHCASLVCFFLGLLQSLKQNSSPKWKTKSTNCTCYFCRLEQWLCSTSMEFKMLLLK